MGTIVVGYVPKPEGDAALARAIEEAKLRGDTLVVVNSHRGGRESTTTAAKDDQQMEAVKQRLADSGVEYDLRQLVRGFEPADLITIAEANSADLIVIGLRRRSPVGKLILGSNAQRILLDAHCAVLASESHHRGPDVARRPPHHRRRARRPGPDRRPLRPAGRRVLRPAVPDGARLPRTGEDPRPVRHPRPGHDRRGRPRGVRGDGLHAAGDPPLRPVDGRPRAGRCPDRHRPVRRSRRTAVDRGLLGSGPAGARDGAARVRQAKAQIFTALLAKRLDVRPEGWEQAVGDYAQDGYRSVADVVDPASLQKVRDYKNAAKVAAKAAAEPT